MLEQKVKAAWRAFIAAKDPSADVSERAWEDLHFTERNAWFSAFRVFVVPTDDPQPVQQFELTEYDAGLLNDFGGGNVEWWQDYIRAELGRAYEHYQSQIPAQGEKQ